MSLTSERIYLAERLQSARGLGWVVTGASVPGAAAEEAASKDGRKHAHRGWSSFLRLVAPLLRHLGLVRG